MNGLDSKVGEFLFDKFCYCFFAPAIASQVEKL